MDLLESFQGEDFLYVVKGVGNGWLELATSLMIQNKEIWDLHALARSVEETNSGFGYSIIRDVLKGLIAIGLVRYDCRSYAYP